MYLILEVLWYRRNQTHFAHKTFLIIFSDGFMFFKFFPYNFLATIRSIQKWINGLLLKVLYRTSFYALIVHCINFMKYGTWNFPTKPGHFDHRIGLYFLPKWNKICQQVTSVYKLLFDAQKIPPLSESLLTSTKISKICTNAISYLNDSNFWQEKDFFIIFSPNES